MDRPGDKSESESDSTREVRAGRMTGDEAAALAGQIGRITQASLPLAGGLRAMAEEIPSRRFRAVVLDLVQRLERGEPLDAALDGLGPLMPEHLRSLVRAGVRSGKLGETLAEYVRCHSLKIQLRRRSIASFIYPFLLLVTFLSILALLMIGIVPAFKKIFLDFGIQLPQVTVSLLAISDCCVQFWPWILVYVAGLGLGVWFAYAVLLGPVARQRVLYRVPLVGAFWRRVALSQFARVLGLLVENELPLPVALRLAGSGVGDAEVADAANELAQEVEAGVSLAESATRSERFPGGLALSLQAGPSAGSFAESLRTAAEMLEGQALIHAEFVFRVAPPLTMIIIVLILGYVLAGLFMPLVKLITQLSG